MRVLLSVLVLALLGATCSASVLEGLDDAQRKELQAGKLVVQSEDVAGGPWPRLMVYTEVDAPVAAVEKVFRDYESAAAYTPGLDSAEVLARPDANTYEVRYTSSMPIVGQSVSTVRNRYRREGETLVVSWQLLEATHADESTGELRVEPLGPDRSVIRYTNYVKPKSSFAVLARSAALNEVKKTVAAIKKESEKRRP